MFSTLTKIHPLWYLLAYVGFVPLFGIVYARAAPDGFYAPYAQFDPAEAFDAEQLAKLLKTIILRTSAARRASAGRGQYKLDGDTLAVDDVRSDGRTVFFNLVDRTQVVMPPRAGATSNTVVQSRSVLPLTISEDMVYPADNRNPSAMLRFVLQDPSKCIPDERCSKQFAYVFWPLAESEEHPNPIKFWAMPDYFKQGPAGSVSLEFQKDEDAQYRRFLKGVQGDPYAMSNNVWRMIYVSVVIITTLGLGDVVPITARARALVGIEAMLGIIFAGLFLNALAYRASKSESAL